jgi:hypothetical protein
VEIAAAFVLLIGAGLLLRTFLSLRNTQTGLKAENVLTLHLTVPATRTPGAGAQYCREIEERIQRIPGVRAVGLVSLLPLQDWGWTARRRADACGTSVCQPRLFPCARHSNPKGP